MSGARPLSALFRRSPALSPRGSSAAGAALKLRGLEEFYNGNKTLNYDHSFGRAWALPELRQKSFEDLEKLWIVLLKERNILSTQRQDAEFFNRDFLGGPKKECINLTMGRIRQVIRERMNTLSDCKKAIALAKSEVFFGTRAYSESHYAQILPFTANDLAHIQIIPKVNVDPPNPAPEEGPKVREPPVGRLVLGLTGRRAWRQGKAAQSYDSPWVFRRVIDEEWAREYERTGVPPRVDVAVEKRFKKHPDVILLRKKLGRATLEKQDVTLLKARLQKQRENRQKIIDKVKADIQRGLDRIRQMTDAPKIVDVSATSEITEPVSNVLPLSEEDTVRLAKFNAKRVTPNPRTPTWMIRKRKAALRRKANAPLRNAAMRQIAELRRLLKKYRGDKLSLAHDLGFVKTRSNRRGTAAQVLADQEAAEAMELDFKLAEEANSMKKEPEQ